MDAYVAKSGVPWQGFWRRPPPVLHAWEAAHVNQRHTVRTKHAHYRCMPALEETKARFNVNITSHFARLVDVSLYNLTTGEDQVIDSIPANESKGFRVQSGDKLFVKSLGKPVEASIRIRSPEEFHYELKPGVVVDTKDLHTPSPSAREAGPAEIGHVFRSLNQVIAHHLHSTPPAFGSGAKQFTRKRKTPVNDRACRWGQGKIQKMNVARQQASSPK